MCEREGGRKGKVLEKRAFRVQDLKVRSLGIWLRKVERAEERGERCLG